MTGRLATAASTHLVRRALRREVTGAAAAADIVTLCAAETSPRRQAVFLPGQLDRIRKLQVLGGTEAQLERLGPVEVTHRPTRALRYRDALLLGGCLYANGSRTQLTMRRPPRMPRRVDQSIASAVLVGTPVSDIFFGHYVMDDSAATLLARDFGAPLGPRSADRARWTHALAYREMMDLVVPEIDDARFDEVWLLDDVGMNSNRRARMIEARDRLRAHGGERDGHAVFLMRGRHGREVRLLKNEQQVADALAAAGFLVVDPMATAAADLVRMLAGARLVVSVEGSAITHGYMTMRQDGAILTIQPPHRFDTIWKDFTDLLDMQYGFVVGAEEPDGAFSADPDDILRTVDLFRL